MTRSETHIGQVATIVVPVTDQDAALTFYVEVLEMQKVNDFRYTTGERWLEVSPAKGSSNLCLVASRPERPAGIETGVVFVSADVLADLAALRGQGLDVDEEPLPEAKWCGGSAPRWLASQRSSDCAIPTATPS
jgi:lactoylglutathione lyase